MDRDRSISLASLLLQPTAEFSGTSRIVWRSDLMPLFISALGRMGILREYLGRPDKPFPAATFRTLLPTTLTSAPRHSGLSGTRCLGSIRPPRLKYRAQTNATLRLMAVRPRTFYR